MRWKATIAYDGTNYFGWQVQPQHNSVQAEVEKVLHSLSSEKVQVHSSGRTDTGVHARGQVGHFDLAREFRPFNLLRGMNSNLPADIRILKLAPCAPDFHARFNTQGKEYRYFIWNGPVLPPDLRNYRLHIYRPLDVDRMNAAARKLVGRRDFASFSANPHREIEGTVRHLTALRVVKKGREICIVARGDGFLYKMVRSLAGFLVRVGAGAQEPAHVEEILTRGIRTARVPTAAPQGLYLWKVFYDESQD